MLNLKGNYNSIKIAIVSKGEFLLVALLVYFSKSREKSLEFSKLAEVMETKGLKILKHCKTRWVEMLAPLKQVMFEWRLLIVKMTLDYTNHPPSRTSYHLLCGIESLLGIACILPLFEVVQSLNKFGQSNDVAFYDFVAPIK